MPPQDECDSVQACKRQCSQFKLSKTKPLGAMRDALKYKPRRLEYQDDFGESIPFRPIRYLFFCYLDPELAVFDKFSKHLQGQDRHSTRLISRSGSFFSIRIGSLHSRSARSMNLDYV